MVGDIEYDFEMVVRVKVDVVGVIWGVYDII